MGELHGDVMGVVNGEWDDVRLVVRRRGRGVWKDVAVGWVPQNNRNERIADDFMVKRYVLRQTLSIAC